MNKYIGTDRVIENIRFFLDWKVPELKKRSPDKYNSMLLKYHMIKTKNYFLPLITEDKKFYDKIEGNFQSWKSKKRFRLSDLELIFDENTLNASFYDIFADEPIPPNPPRDWTYHYYLSKKSATSLVSYFNEQLNNNKLKKEKKDILIKMLVNGIKIPIMYHITTQSILCIRYYIDNESNKQTSHEIYALSLKKINQKEDENGNKGEFYIEERKTLKNIRDMETDFKTFCDNKTHLNQISTLGIFIKENIKHNDPNNYMDYLQIVEQEPLFTVFRSVESTEASKPPKKAKEKESLSSMISSSAAKKKNR